jgi:hypothetical protein
VSLPLAADQDVVAVPAVERVGGGIAGERVVAAAGQVLYARIAVGLAHVRGHPSATVAILFDE